MTSNLDDYDYDDYDTAYDDDYSNPSTNPTYHWESTFPGGGGLGGSVSGGPWLHKQKIENEAARWLNIQIALVVLMSLEIWAESGLSP